MKIQIVDEQDRLIGLKERGEVDYKNDIYRISVLWITNSNDQVLLARRASIKDKDPGKWGPAVGGTLEEGETYESNIYKEAIEEIGLDGVKFNKGIKIHNTHIRNFFSQWFCVELDREINSFVMQADEVDDLRWFSVGELRQELITYPNKYQTTLPLMVKELCK